MEGFYALSYQVDTFTFFADVILVHRDMLGIKMIKI